MPWAQSLEEIRPHPQDADNALSFEHFVDEPVLDVDSPREFPGQVADQLFVGRRFFAVINGPFEVLDRPTHQSSSLTLSPRGSLAASRIDSRIPGTEQR